VFHKSIEKEVFREKKAQKIIKKNFAVANNAFIFAALLRALFLLIYSKKATKKMIP